MKPPKILEIPLTVKNKGGKEIEVCRLTYVLEQMCHNADTDDDCYFRCSECHSSVLVEYKSGGYGVPRYCPSCGRRVV